MAMLGVGFFFFLLLVFLPIVVVAEVDGEDITPVKTLGRSDYPSDFVFGAATAAYQIEGAAKEGGRGPSIWDYFIEKNPDKIADRKNADVAIDTYHRYKEDIGYMKDTGLDALRLSISWSRILPNGKLSGGINKVGVEYYNNFINDLLSKGIQPYVTIFHWDLPQTLDAEYGGFLSTRVVDDYVQYADLLFKLYGDRVKHWITFNEPYSFCERGYSSGTFAPERCSKWLGCPEGDSGREPYVACHHLLLAHAAAVKLYKNKNQASQKGIIGITLVTHYFIPYSKSKSDIDAASRALDFFFGWFMDPLTTGDYPFTMRAIAGDRLPVFTAAQSTMLIGSFDFLGLNYYTTQYAKSISLLTKTNISYDNDMHVYLTGERNGKLIGKPTGSNWLFIYPKGLKDLLIYIKDKYNNPIIYITENGVDTLANASIPLKVDLKDDIRIEYLKGHLWYLHSAIKKGSKVKGYFTWTMFDDFEWDAGFTVRFGLYFVDFNTLQRYPKNPHFGTKISSTNK